MKCENFKYAMIIGAFTLRAFDNSNGWKTDADGNLVKDDAGNPIYVDSSGQEKSILGDTISRLNGEAKTNRERAETAEAKLKDFEGIDPKATKEQLAKLKNLESQKLIDAGEVDRVRTEIQQSFQSEIEKRDSEIQNLRGENKKIRLDSAFATSKFVADSVVIPPDFFRDKMSKHFDVDEKGKIIATDENGNPIYSAKNMGEPASFDEALSILISKREDKDDILRAATPSGTGSDGRAGTNGRKPVITRADFDKMSPLEKQTSAQKVSSGELTIVD